MFTFSNDYIQQSIRDMVNREADRIVSLKLATSENINKFVSAHIDEQNGDQETFIKSLAKVHSSLSEVYLPGDFEKIAGELLSSPQPEAQEKQPDEEDAEEKDLSEVATEEPEGLFTVLNSLNSLIYKLGTNGEQEKAYQVERMVGRIEALKASLSKEDINKMAKELMTALGEDEDVQAEDEIEPSSDGGTPSIAINQFVTRQTPESKYSHFDGTWDQLVGLVKQNFSRAKPGYMEGVKLIPVPSEGFYTSITELQPGAAISAKYEARREGENPYMQLTTSGGDKLPAKSVDVVVYSHDVLTKDNENSTDADWEIISINASPWEGTEGESEPLMPEALMRNYFGEPGGSQMEGVSPDKFVEMLRRSREYWRNKIMLG